MRNIPMLTRATFHTYAALILLLEPKKHDDLFPGSIIVLTVFL
jgi:hypothetical protein